MVTHWMTGSEVCSRAASVCRATLTIVVSKTTARAPTMRIRALLSTAGSILSLLAPVMPASAVKR